MILLPYVHDLFVTCEDGLISYTKTKLAGKFKMKELGMMHYFLGMEVLHSTNAVFLGQGKYTLEILNNFGMMDCKEIATPMALNLKLLFDASSELVDATIYRQMIGSLMYLTNTIPNICFAMNTLS